MPENDTFPLDPDYGLSVDETDGVVRQRAEGGRAIQWQQRPAQRIFTLPFEDRPTDDVEQLRDWKRRFAASFFVFNHKVWVNNAGTYLARKFPVEWLDDTLPAQLTRNESYDFQIRLIEAVGRALPTNYVKDGERLDSANWGNNSNGVADPTVTADVIGDPEGNPTAEQIDFPATGAGQYSGRMQTALGVANLVRGRTYTFQIRLKSTGNTTIQIVIEDNPFSEASGLVANVTAAWQVFKITHTFSGTAGETGISVHIRNPENQGAKTIHAGMARLVPGDASVLYPEPVDGHPAIFLEETDGLILAGSWPVTWAGHGNRRLDNANTNTTDAFQWIYTGYGFDIWATRWNNLGRGRVFLDGVDLGIIEHYGVNTTSVPLFQKWDVPLGLHRVKIVATNDKHASSSAKTLPADALRYMP